jgi:hypothetical protein
MVRRSTEFVVGLKATLFATAVVVRRAQRGSPDDHVLTQEWESLEALRVYIRSNELYDFRRHMLHMMTRPWQLTLHFVRESVALEDYAPMDPRRAD